MYYFLGKDIHERTIKEANYIVEHGATIRETAHAFNISKTVVHKDVTERLRTYNLALAMKVAKVLAKNKAERHIRGGKATKKKNKLALNNNYKGEK